MVRAKMVCAAFKHHHYHTRTARRRQRWSSPPQYDDSIPEDQRFQKATPSGSISMQIDNPAARDQFEIGKAYYVDFNPVESA